MKSICINSVKAILALFSTRSTCTEKHQNMYISVLSSSELKAQVELFSSPVVRGPSVCPSDCLPICKLSTFSYSSSEPLGQFQPNLAQSNPGLRGFKFVQMKRHAVL